MSLILTLMLAALLFMLLWATPTFKWPGSFSCRPRTSEYHDFDYHDWSPPHYKEHYSSHALTFDKPHLIIHNKFAKEW